jgi:hypothetical protein
MQYGYWKVRIMQKHGRAPAVRQYVPAAFVTGLAVLAVAALTGNTAVRSLLWIVLASYALVLLVASVTTAARYGWDLLPILPVTFATYHFGYGVGFLIGILDFVLLKRSRPRPSMARLTR